MLIILKERPFDIPLSHIQKYRVLFLHASQNLNNTLLTYFKTSTCTEKKNTQNEKLFYYTTDYITSALFAFTNPTFKHPHKLLI